MASSRVTPVGQAIEARWPADGLSRRHEAYEGTRRNPVQGSFVAFVLLRPSWRAVVIKRHCRLCGSCV